jgi:FMN-dependent NADH-azoreductase
MHKSFVLYYLFMSHLLHVDTSFRTEGSRSRRLTASYAEGWKAKNPAGTVAYRDLAADPVPYLDGTVLSAQFTAPSNHTPEQAAAHALVEV